MIKRPIAAILFPFNLETLRLGDDDTRQEQETNQVRNRHQSVEDVRDGPNQIQVRRHRAESGDDDIHHPIRDDGFLPEQVIDRPFPIITPADDRREGEEDE